MRVIKKRETQMCQAVHAFFVFGPQMCHHLTRFVIVSADPALDNKPICTDHIIMQRNYENEHPDEVYT